MIPGELPPPMRLAQLDGLRGLAACIVTVFHGRILFGQHVNPLDGLPGMSWIQVWGWSMVDLFFVLSGFVFAHCYLKDWQMRPKTTLAGFALSRFARLWPLHLALTGLTALVLWHDPATTWQNALISLTMLHVFLPGPTNTLNGPAWSLSVEVVCYAAFAISAARGSKTFRSVACISIGVGAWAVATQGNWDTIGLLGRGLFGYFIGVLLCQSLSLWERIPTFLLLPLACLPLVVLPTGPSLMLATAVAWPAIVVLALRSDILKAAPFVWLGDRSYTIYLMHIPIYAIALNLAERASIESRNAWLAATLISWAAILLLSDALYRRYERPARQMILGLGNRSRDNIVTKPARLNAE